MQQRLRQLINLDLSWSAEDLALAGNITIETALEFKAALQHDLNLEVSVSAQRLRSIRQPGLHGSLRNMPMGDIMGRGR
jgi:hypothetical protein